MSLGNVSLVGPSGLQQPASWTWPVAAAATTINAGEPCKLSSTYAVPSADAEPVTSAPTFLGIAASTSNQTATVDGKVNIYMLVPGLVYSCLAKLNTTFNTAAKIQALIGATVLFDLTASVYTVDVASAGATDGVLIVGGDPVTSTVYFMIRSAVGVNA